MKSTFSDKAHAIWAQIQGTKGFLSSNRIQNLVDILHRELDLAPRMIRYGQDYHAADLRTFMAWRNRDFPDDYCTVYYHPEDCAKVTGSAAQNWLQWSNLLLGYRRRSHPFAIRMKPTGQVAKTMEADGLATGTTRFLSLELVIFYLAVQTQTWGPEGRILTVKDLITQNDIGAIMFVPATAEDVNVDELFPRDTPAPTPPKTRVPKAGQGLLDYRPVGRRTFLVEPLPDGALPVYNDEPTTPAVRQPVNAPIAAPAVDLPVDVSKMSPSELQAYIAGLQATLEAKIEAEKIESEREKRWAHAATASIIAGDSALFFDRGIFHTLAVEYEDGTKAVYIHEEVVAERVRRAYAGLVDAAQNTKDMNVADLLAG